MRITTLFLRSLCLTAFVVLAIRTEAQVTQADYLRVDTFLKCSGHVYSAAVNPEWIDSSHYFWYKNHEREGDFFYLVNAETGKKQRTTEKKKLASFFSGKHKYLAEFLLKEEDKKPDKREKRKHCSSLPRTNNGKRM